MHKVLLWLSLLCISFHCCSQESGTYYNFQNNYILTNPAFSGVGHTRLISLSSEIQPGFELKSKLDGSFLLDTRIKEKAGINITLDGGSDFLYTNRIIMIGGAYEIFSRNKLTLNVGLSGGAYLKEYGKYLVFTDSVGNTINQPVISQPTFKAGLMLKSGKWTFGYSSTQINQPKFDRLYYQSRRQHHLMLEFRTHLGSNWSFQPSVLAKIWDDFFSIRLNTPFQFKEKLLLGLGFDKPRFNYYSGHKVYGFAANAGINIKSKMQLQYSMIYTSSELTPTRYLVHQINLSYNLK
jgi:type IX secretion system PorP/SprF family membrane protein